MARGRQSGVLLAALALLLLSAPCALAQGSPAMPPGFGARSTDASQARVHVSQVDGGCEDKTYPECRRLRYSFGPLTVAPGNNAQLYGQTVGKPEYDGYVTRMKADMIRTDDGKPPPTEQLMLHHAVWLAVPQYGNFLPFYGVGEEKTAMSAPPGYGMLVRSGDVWLMNHMLHNATSVSQNVAIVYDIDYVPRAAAEGRGIKPVKPLWIDVKYDDTPAYPVFNAQKGFGRVNASTGRRECTFPRDRCAAFDPWDRDQPGNGKGYDWTVPGELSGTLVAAGGHLHPGGLRDELSVVRTVGGREEERRIFTSEARYYDPAGPVSWDMSMTVTPRDWRVRIRPGERIRLNAVYESQQASWYEGMGIVMAFVAPGDESGVDPFAKRRVRRKSARERRLERRIRRLRTRIVRLRRAERRLRRAGGSRTRIRRLARRRRSASRDRRVLIRRLRRVRRRYGYPYEYLPIATRGDVTHGRLPENANHGGGNVRGLPAKEGPLTSDVSIANFAYYPGDLSRVGSEGIPRVRAGQPLTFRNYDSAASIWHTITTCEAPCTGATGISYPLANALPALDSLELGYGYPEKVQPTAQRSTYRFTPRDAGLTAGKSYTYFCRIHPSMRGAFKVVD